MSIRPATAPSASSLPAEEPPHDRQGPPRLPRSETDPAARRDDGTRAARSGQAVDNSRRPSHSSSAGVREDRAGRRSRAGHRASSRRSRSSAVSTLIHGAASSRASGRASSRRQIAVTVGPFADVRRKSGCTSRTRSTNSRTAGERARSAGDVASESTSNASGPTAYSRSPRTRSGARLVTSTRSEATDCQEIRDQRRRVQDLLEIVEHQQRRRDRRTRPVRASASRAP